MWRNDIDKELLKQYDDDLNKNIKVIIEKQENSFKEYYICYVFLHENGEIYFNLNDNLLKINEINRFMFLKDLAELKTYNNYKKNNYEICKPQWIG